MPAKKFKKPVGETVEEEEEQEQDAIERNAGASALQSTMGESIYEDFDDNPF